MDQATASLHEPREHLKAATIDRHRALVSLMEELEAMDWYDQRVDACEDEALRRILAHNRDEEKEHAVMLLEWLRRHDPELSRQLGLRLFGAEAIAVEEDALPTTSPTSDGSLGIGSLRGEGR